MTSDPRQSASPWKLRGWLLLVAAVLFVGVMAWSSDTVTLQDEWTLYTARCEGGVWQGKHCPGRLVNAERHHFVVDKPKREVAFEVTGAVPSPGRLSGCTIDDGRNWACSVGGAGAVPITRELIRGVPVDPKEGPGHALLVSKRTWFLLRLGIPAGSDASEPGRRSGSPAPAG